VVGQVLDYAANVWEMDPEDFAQAFARARGQDPFELLRSLVSNADQWDESHVRAEVARRLDEGRFRLLIAVDKIDESLRRIITYVNGRSAGNLKLVAVEFPLYRSGDTEVVVTETFGDEGGGRPAVAERRRWTTEEFRREFRDVQPLSSLHERFVIWANDRGVAPVYGRGSTAPSVSFQFWPDRTSWYPLFVLWPDRGGRVEIQASFLESRGIPDSVLLEVRRRLNEGNVALRDGARGAWVWDPDPRGSDGAAFFLTVMDWFLSELQTDLKR
jgi:hypothetical protein